MASYVQVIDSTARSTKINTTPSKQLSDILHEACEKLKLDSNKYTLKRNNKPIDLSLPFRLSGLTNAAKLDLVQLSRSPTVVSVALGLPAEDNNQRLTAKFASNTSAWQILRQFESGAGSTETPPKTFNFTQRAVPSTDAGSGRLYYSMPVLNFMGKELGTFSDLQKTLAQLGCTSGSILLRLSYKSTGQPLEEAMEEISQYFKDLEVSQPIGKAHGAHAGSIGDMTSTPNVSEPQITEDIAGSTNNEEPTTAPLEEVISTSEEPAAGPTIPEQSVPEGPASEDVEVEDNTIVGPSSRPTQIFAASSDPSRIAALTSYNDSDYEPTIDDAKRHQARLAELGKNKRLPSDAEIAAQENAKKEKLDAVQDVTVRVRFPDGNIAQTVFSRLDTADALYDYVRQLLRDPQLAFSLRYTSAQGKQVELGRGKQRLIQDLKWQGKMLVNFLWGDSVSAEDRNEDVLKGEYSDKAVKLEIPSYTNNERQGTQLSSSSQNQAPEKKQLSGTEKESKMKKFLMKGFKK